MKRAVLSLIVLLSAASAWAQSPNYGSGFTSSGLTLNGGVTISGTNLQVTDGGSGEARSAFFNTPVNVQSFITDFTFQLANANADGFTFTIQGNNPTALGGAGGSLGYGPITTGGAGGIANSVAVKFDLYSNAGEGSDSTGLYTDGASPTIPATDMTSSGVDLHSGDVMSVHMSYDGTTLTWRITDSTAGTSFTTSATINIPSVVLGSTAYVGFTGGTGGLTATQDILTWTYTPSAGAPTITTQPSNQTVTAGQTAMFTVVASGSTPLSYQWLENTGSGFANITTGGTSASYTTPATTIGNSGTTFEVMVSNAQGSVTSNTATLTVNAASTSPSYGSGFTSTGLTLNNGAAISGTRLRVTDGGTGEARSAFFSTPVNVQSFTNAFTFQDTSASADGLCFVIEASGPTALGGAGGSLGYAGTTGALSTNSLCVSFDLYNNKTGSEISNTGLFTNGASPSGGAGSAAGSLSFQSGDVMSVQMNYNGTTLTMQITDTVTSATYSTSFTVDIPTVVGGSTAFVGFTGGTGGLTATQDILTWTYTPTGGTPVAPTITTQPSNQTVTAGQTATFTVVASGTAPLSYQWLQNTGSGFTNITTGGTSASYTTPATTIANNGTTFEVKVSNAQGSVTSNTATLTVNGAPTITTQPSNQTVTAGQTATFTVVASGTAPLSYQWLQNTGSGFTNITTGGTSASYTTPATTIANNGTTFEVKVSNAQGSVTSNTATLTVNGAPTITTQPSNQTVTAGQTATFTVVASGTAPLSYQWLQNTGSGFTNITTGGTSASYTTPATTIANNGTTFEVKVSNAQGSVTSNTATLTVNAAPTITTQPSNRTVTAGQTATFTVVASGTAPLSYQWLQNTGAGFTNITTGGTSASYTTPATTIANNGTTFEVKVSNAQGSVTSNTAMLTVNAAPTITTQPSNRTVTAGQTATFTVVASGTAPLSYQWLQNTGSGFTNITTGGTSASYTTPATTIANNGTTFEVKVSNAQGSVTSNTATLTVNAAGTSPSYGSGFTSTGLTLNNGAAISGTRLRLTDGGTGEARSAFFSTPVNVQSFTNAFTFQDTSASADGLCFVIEASGPTALGGAGGSLGYAGTTGALSTNSLCVSFDLYNNKTGSEISNTGLFTNGASPSGGAGSAAGSLSFQSGDVMSVQMNYNGTTLTMQITDTVTSATYSTSFTVDIPTVVGGSTAFAGFTGGTGGLTATQDILTWTYTPTGGTPVAPTITTQPSNQTVTAGQTATFTVVASGTAPLSYQWLQNTGSGFTNITTGGTSASYTTPATTIANNGTTFEVKVSNAQGSVTSNTATLTVNAAGTSPSYGSGFTSSGLTLNGGATISGTNLQLTDGGSGEARSAFFNTPVNVQSFITDFTFQLANANADGFTFTIQGNNPTALGGAGGSLGYGPINSGGTGGIANSVAVKFDLYSNAGEAPDSTGLYTDGASPTIPATDMTSSGVDLHSGDVMSAHLAYDGTTLTLIVTDTTTNASFGTTFTVNIPGTVGAATAYVGFTGGTGGLTATQDILSWAYNAVPVTAFAWPVNTPITYAPSANGGINDYSTFALQSPIFGQYHTGIDVCPQSPGCAIGNSVYASSSGIVELALVVSDATETLCDGSSTAGYQINPSTSNLGNVVVIAHPNGKFTLYGHMDCIWPGIVPGLEVSAGTQIGNMGHSGFGNRDNTFTPHTHFELKDRAVTGDPDNLGYSGYTTDVPDGYGYHDARILINPFSPTSISPTAVKVVASSNVLTGPGSGFAVLATVAPGQEFVAFASSGSWYQVYLPNDNAPISGWIQGTPDSTATQVQVTGASSSGLLIQTGPSSSTNLVSWDQTFYDCVPSAKIFNGQRYVSPKNQSGFTEFYLPLNYYFSSANACAQPSGPGPSLGWASSSFLP